MRATVVRGARTHNLKGVDLELRPGELVAFTGPSGAGKSSLGIDTIYAEGQRRFVESFSPYARQFLERLDRPPADKVEPVAAGVAVDRKAPVKSSRSTVATMAELEPYLAALFSREAVPVCPDCHVPARELDVATAAKRTIESSTGRAIVTYPTRVDGPEGYLQLREQLVRDGYRRLLIGGEIRTVDDVKPSEAVNAPVEVIVDRISLDESGRARLQEALEQAWSRSDGRAHIITDDDKVTKVARGLACPSCSRTFDPPRAGLFSYNNPAGACATCRGFGRTIGIDWHKVIPDHDKTLAQGAIRAWAGSSAEWERGELKKLCKKHGIPMDVPWSKLPASSKKLILDGEPGGYSAGVYPGIKAWFEWLQSRTYKMHVRVFLARYRSYDPCAACDGTRLNDEARMYQVDGLALPSWHRLSVAEANTRVQRLQCKDAGAARAAEVLRTRLSYLVAVGLGHLSLDRQARTLSGGEAQRVSLTAALGTSLVGALFVVDEPTVGLHVTDVPPLIDALKALARAGNAVVVIEHDPRVVAACDRVVELGPGAGPHGGTILFDGTPLQLSKRKDLPSGPTLAGDRSNAQRPRGRSAKGSLVVRGARAHNLKNLDVTIPLGVLTTVTGPSGSGKSTLIGKILAPAVMRATGTIPDEPALSHETIDGLAAIRRVVHVDQAPLGRTSRGNAATYTKGWDFVRELFSKDAERLDGGELPPASHFSFNTEGGRCDTCGGEGYETVEMQFLADVAVRCPVCKGRRFKDEILAIKLHGKNVADLLEMTVDEVTAWASTPSPKGTQKERTSDWPTSPWSKLRRALEPLSRIGLGYLPLGQPLSTVSGGEAQRLKLARALVEAHEGSPSRKRGGEGTLVLVDEPSAGLHATDVAKVVDALQTLVDDGATVVVVEHDLDLIAAADHIIDLGPGGGAEGGTLVAQGTVDTIVKTPTRTGLSLRDHLKGVKITGAAGSVSDRSFDAITVKHAKEHNLKDITIDIPHGKLVVVTGPSGSGKSTLAFDVIFAEGQRRFLETLSAYARQFLPTLPRPDVEAVLGVPPSIALEQRTTRGGRTSTVATVTEVAHYLRLLYAKVGTPHCPKCESAIVASDPTTIFARIRALHGPVTVYARAVRARKGTHLDVFTRATRAGYKEARVDGKRVTIDPPPELTRAKEHTIELIACEGDPRKFEQSRITDALARGDGEVIVSVATASVSERSKSKSQELVFSTKRACPSCGTGIPELDPRWFSFNTAQGRCPTCEGSGVREEVEESDRDAKADPCKTCHGQRLGPIPRRVQIDGETYPSLTARSVDDVLKRAGEIEKVLLADPMHKPLAEAPVAELKRRLEFLVRVGLGYLALDRAARTLSGGEMQRLRLAAQLGSGLTGALYVLDEPTIGLHPRDTTRLISNLRALVDTGSTVMVVEHDADTIKAADHLIDIGPTGGRGGGHIVAHGPPSKVLEHPDSPTGHALRTLDAPRPPTRITSDVPHIELRNARGHNLRGVDFKVPVGRMTVVAGVSGSGKSTLVRQVFYPALRKALKLEAPPALPNDGITGHKHVVRAIAVDQSPIGRTPRSVPATFLGIFDAIRKLFASTPEAQIRGFAPARFSFNSNGGGRCTACDGQGMVVSEMTFLPDVVSPCEACDGMRYEPSTLDVKYLGRSIGEVLQMTAREACELFAAHPSIHKPLKILDDLGVGYLALGQGSNTLSGGEAQRLKLAAELSETARRLPTLYVLDEPTTGLHMNDVRKLLDVMQRLVARGDTLVVIEHHPDVIASADHVIELGPEGGSAGGVIVAEGTPTEVSKQKTATGRVLREVLRPRIRRSVSAAESTTP